MWGRTGGFTPGYSICSPPGSTASRVDNHLRCNLVRKVLKQLLGGIQCADYYLQVY
ncbi:hypothetical protein SBA2_180002 [Acidobacteriia bacterium SbA2]|nr:hypothetical protein SBA2_180002 [Acidobacteriia bacterium SbA2]